MADFELARARMVERQLRARGIGDERVLAAMGAVPRELFVDDRLRRRAYADSALPTGDGQTISQPWIVAAICQGMKLAGPEKVLEVGTGSGYSTAVLASLAQVVVSVERFPALAQAASERLAELGVANAEIRVGDGSTGVPELAPYGAIAVHATAPAPPPSLLAQLEIGGRLVAPIAEGRTDMLVCFTRTGAALELEAGTGVERAVIAPARFVPLIGEEGFAPS